jgi:hypothetical protein
VEDGQFPTWRKPFLQDLVGQPSGGLPCRKRLQPAVGEFRYWKHRGRITDPHAGIK